jgi:hypothetical protein
MGLPEVATRRDWFPTAACIQVDMERGIYKPADGREWKRKGVVKQEILRACGITTNYHNARERIWEHPAYLKCLEDERRKRDLGIQHVISDIEQQVGPLHATRLDIQKNMVALFAKAPDAEDPEALSPKDYATTSLQWIRYIDEVEGRGEARKQDAIADIAQSLAKTNAVTSEAMADVASLMRQFHEQEMSKLGVIEGRGEWDE